MTAGRRRRRALAALAALALPTLAAACTAGRAARAPNALVGTWRVAAVENRDSAGALVLPFGDRPAGYFVYAPDGHFQMQIARTPMTPRFAAGADRGGTGDELRAAFEGYFAWFGRYAVDERARTVTHRIEGSLWPSYAGTKQPRPYRLAGDSLILGDERTARRVLIRSAP